MSSSSPSFTCRRIMAAATSGYAVFALARPDHLSKAMKEPRQRDTFRRLAYTYGVRDLATSAMLIPGDVRLARAAAAIRIAGDLGDAAILGGTASSPEIRKKVLSVTVSWAALNAVAWWIDEKRSS